MRGARGQALVELAVFGAVALAALGFLIRIGMKMNFDQEIRMAAFRKALAAAHADDGAVTRNTNDDAVGVLYHYIATRQMPNPTDGLLTLPRTRTEASAFVEWGDRFTMAYDGAGDNGRKTSTKYFVRSDGTESRPFRAEEFPHDIDLGAVTIDAFESVIRESRTTNTTGGSLTAGPAGSHAGSTTTTCSHTTVNTLAGDGVDSCLTSSSTSW